MLNYHHGGGLALIVGSTHSRVSVGVVVVAHGLTVQLLGAGNALGLALGVQSSALVRVFAVAQGVGAGEGGAHKLRQGCLGL